MTISGLGLTSLSMGTSATGDSIFGLEVTTPLPPGTSLPSSKSNSDPGEAKEGSCVPENRGRLHSREQTRRPPRVGGSDRESEEDVAGAIIRL